jgi:hypothetical protein
MSKDLLPQQPLFFRHPEGTSCREATFVSDDERLAAAKISFDTA